MELDRPKGAPGRAEFHLGQGALDDTPLVEMELDRPRGAPGRAEFHLGQGAKRDSACRDGTRPSRVPGLIVR